MSFAAALEPLRAANHLAEEKLFEISMHSDNGGWVGSYCGMFIETEDLPTSSAGISVMSVVAGGQAAQSSSRRIDACLRRADRFGTTLGGITAGPFLLARAGLLESERFTIHWEHIDLVKEMFPSLTPEPARFVRDGRRITCGGGIAALDMMNSFISDRMGAACARKVNDWFLHTKSTFSSYPQRGTVPERHEVRNKTIARAIAVMEENLSKPIARDVIATSVGVSSRHLERLFVQDRGMPFSEIYMQLRMAQAQRLLWQSALSISEISMASGFASLPHFSRTFTKRYGKRPKQWRRQMLTQSHWFSTNDISPTS